MNLAIIQPVADVRHAARAYRDEVALLAAVLGRAGHAVTLAVLAPDEAGDAARALAEAQPDVILLYVEGLSADAAAKAAGSAASAVGAPLVAFGPHARLCPDACLSLAGAEAVAVAPGPWVVPEYVEARGGRIDSLRTPGLWVKCETGVMRNAAPRPPASLGDEPLPNRGLYTSDQTLDAAGFAPITVARGGEGPSPTEPTGAPGAPGARGSASAPGKPPAPPLPGPAAAPAPWPVLHRPVEAILEEMHEVAAEQLDLGGWSVGNARWTADPAYLEAFAERYAREVGLPLRTVLHAADVTPETAALLARAGCNEVTLPLGSASNLIRTEVLGLDASAEAVAAAAAALRQAGIRTAVAVEIGAPYETPVTIDETVELLRRLAPDRVAARLHWPEPGSASERIAREHEWLVPDPASAYLAGGPAVVPASLSAEALLEAAELLPYRVLRPRVVPLLRLARRVRIPGKGTVYECLVKPFLVPPVRKA